jgi:hypothetical protein
MALPPIAGQFFLFQLDVGGKKHSGGVGWQHPKSICRKKLILFL